MYGSRRFQCCYPIDIPAMKLHDINEDLEEFKYTVKTQAVAELTNYRGLHDWGEVRYIVTIRSSFV